MIGDDIVVTVVEMRGDVARVGIAAPRHVRVHREEVYREVAGVNESAATATATDASRLAALVAAGRHPAPPTQAEPASSPATTSTTATTVPKPTPGPPKDARPGPPPT